MLHGLYIDRQGQRAAGPAALVKPETASRLTPAQKMAAGCGVTRCAVVSVFLPVAATPYGLTKRLRLGGGVNPLSGLRCAPAVAPVSVSATGERFPGGGQISCPATVCTGCSPGKRSATGRGPGGGVNPLPGLR